MHRMHIGAEEDTAKDRQKVAVIQRGAANLKLGLGTLRVSWGNNRRARKRTFSTPSSLVYLSACKSGQHHQYAPRA